MKSSTLHDMINKVFGDETLKARFLAHPESVLSEYTLSDEETRAVLSTHRMFTAGNTSLEAAITAKEGWGAALEATITTKEGWGIADT
jgi:hypothetical protein